jgi:hypothetical protein
MGWGWAQFGHSPNYVSKATTTSVGTLLRKSGTTDRLVGVATYSTNAPLGEPSATQASSALFGVLQSSFAPVPAATGR